MIKNKRLWTPRQALCVPDEIKPPKQKYLLTYHYPPESQTRFSGHVRQSVKPKSELPAIFLTVGDCQIRREANSFQISRSSKARTFTCQCPQDPGSRYISEKSLFDTRDAHRRYSWFPFHDGHPSSLWELLSEQQVTGSMWSYSFPFGKLVKCLEVFITLCWYSQQTLPSKRLNF